MIPKVFVQSAIHQSLSIAALMGLGLGAFAAEARAQSLGTNPAPVQSHASNPMRTAARPVRGQLFNEKALRPFLQKLSRVQTTQIHILQIGDSHTAGDLFTGGWRALWQLEYGPGGRGMMAVGRPTSAYVTQGVTARQTGPWVATGLLGSSAARADTALGPSGVTQTALRAGATATLSADSVAYHFDSFTICGLTGPEMGSILVTLGPLETPISFAAPAPGFDCFETRSPNLLGQATLKTLEDKPVKLTSWTTKRGSNGVILSNLGVVSARLQHWARLADPVVAKELSVAKPDLVVLAFGTNEGFFSGLSVAAETDVLREQVRRLRSFIGDAVPILLLGPPDVTTARADIALPTLPETVPCPGGRYVPGNIARMRSLQKKLAAELNLAFWDWQGAMGGACSATFWTAQGLQRGDFIHFTAAGGMMLGQALASDLEDAQSRLEGN